MISDKSLAMTRLFGLITIGIAMMPAVAVAQNDQEMPADPATGEIVVTAQKREQSARDVAISLSVYSGEELARQNITVAADIAKLTPAVGVSGSFAGQNVTFSIRGVTQQDFQAHSEAPVAVYIDEGYLAANNAAGIGLLDIQRVEVLKGPQGTLFGRNATGGLVSIISNKPTKYWSASASASYASYNDVQLQGAVGGPVAENAQFRLAGMYHSNDGWLENINPNGGDLGGKETISVRGQLAVQPTGNLDLLFIGYYSDVRQSWGPYTLLSTRSTIAGGIPNAVIVNSPTLFGESPSDFRNLRVNANSAQSSGAYNTIGGGTFKADLDLGDAGDLTAITDYKVLTYDLRLDSDASAISFLDSITTANVENWSQELRYFKDFGGVRLTAGAYYLNINARTTDLQRLFGLGGVQVRSPFGLKTDSYSGFAQAEFSLLPVLTLVTGFRATREEKDYRYNAFVEALDGTPLVAGRAYAAKSGQWLYSGKAQLEYRPNKDLLVYAGYNRGTKAGSFNAPFAGGATPADADIPYKAEVLHAYEAGFKSSLLSGLATLDASAFYYDYNNFQAFKFVNFSTVVGNNPATVKGAEIALNMRPAQGLEIQAGVSYVDANVENVTLSNAMGIAIVDRRPPFTSKWQANGSIRYAFAVGGGEASLQGDVQYRSTFYFSLTNFDATKVTGYALLGARAAWQTPDEKWEFAVFGKNLTDKRYRTVGFEASDFGGFTQVGYGEPRWIGGSISYRFKG
jgi:iron complex outermembrane recepter protein